ncbi:MAG: response regulator [Gammaproteobacteria bacterium]|nr:response regulator [Gammaproteobacteria bacterium]
MAEQIYTPNEVAALLGVAPVTVRQWAQKGLIEARTTAGGHRRFTHEAVAAFATRMGMTLPAEFAGAAAGLRVLVVDDDRQFNGMLVAMFALRAPQAVVETAFDGFEAGRTVQRFAPNVVVLDIMMPGIDGVEVCRAVKSDPATAGALVVAMTGHHTIELEQRVLAAGAATLLKKPFHMDELLTACGLSLTETV